VTNEEILAEIERRIADWFTAPGWSEENAGLRLVARTISELRREGKSRDWDE
jgi:hypothetical protein